MTPYDPILVKRLVTINLEDILTSLGWDQLRFGRAVLAWPFRDLARRFAYQVLDFDRAVSEMGLQAGSLHFLQSLQDDLIIEGQERIPHTGPVLFLSNHPGILDTVSLFASIPRPDLRIVAAERPFLKALPSTDPRLIYVSEDAADRVKVLRAVAAQLRAGGAVLTFPAGHIEPDPAVLPGAASALANWSTSIGVFARLEPAAVLMPVIVRGVLSHHATFHPLTHLRRKPSDRERLGATLQIMSSVLWPSLWPHLWKVSIQVCFGPPIPASELIPLHDPRFITEIVIERAKSLL
jgi:1-acyl-sn-glycerol-3-phosphate acyltransferase